MGVENNIPEGWLESILGEVISTNDESISKNYPHQEIIYIDTGSVTKNKIEAYQVFNLKEAPSRAKRLVRDGDIIYSTVRPDQEHYGYLVSPQINYVVSTGFCVIRAKNDSDSKFIYYFLTQRSVTKFLHTIGEQNASTYPSINPYDIEKLVTYLPPLPEQKAIAKVLTAFDDKIELLQAQNYTLETMAQTIFKEWFGKYQVGDELPDGWKEDSLDNIALEITRGFTTSYVEKSDIINLNQKVNKGEKLDKQHFKYYPNDTIVPRNKFIKKHDILLNSLGQGTLGRVHLYKENTTNVVADQHVSILRFSNDLSYYVYQILASKSGQYRLENEITGSTGMLMLNIGRIRDFRIIVPTKEKLELFKKSLDPIYGKLEINQNQIQSLIKTRDTLLPKLMSGQVRVNNIKQTANA